MAKSYTIKKKDDGTTSITRTNNDGTKTNVDKNFAPTNSAVGRDGNIDSSINANPSGKGYAGVSTGGSSSSSSNSSSSSRDALINQYVNSAKQAKINQLKNAYNQNINAIAQQERETAQNAQANRNTASVQSQLAQRQLDNYLAANGLLNSGTNAQARMNNVGALQNTLGGITANEQNALNQLANQRTLAQTNLNNDIAAANAGYDAQALQMQLQYLDQLEQMRMQQEFANQQALQQRQWQVQDRDYNRDMNYIWDNNLGRYVDSNAYWNNYWNNNLTAYQKAQIANANRTANANRSSGGGSSAPTYATLSGKSPYEEWLNEFKVGITGEDFNTWNAQRYGTPTNENVTTVAQQTSYELPSDLFGESKKESKSKSKSNAANILANSAANAINNAIVNSINKKKEKVENNNIYKVIKALSK